MLIKCTYWPFNQFGYTILMQFIALHASQLVAHLEIYCILFDLIFISIFMLIDYKCNSIPLS